MNVCIIGGGGQIAESVGNLLVARGIPHTFYRPRKINIPGVPRRPDRPRFRLEKLETKTKTDEAESYTGAYSWADDGDLKKTDVFIYTLPSFLAEYIGFELASYLSGKVVINVSDRFLGTYALSKAVKMRMFKPISLGVGFNSPPFLAYQLSRRTATNIYYQKPFVIAGCFPVQKEDEARNIVSSIFGLDYERVKIVSSCVDLAFENINSILHVVQDLVNLKKNKYDKIGQLYGRETYTPEMVGRIIELVRERDQVALYFTSRRPRTLEVFDGSTFFNQTINGQLEGGSAEYRHHHPMLSKIPTPLWYSAHGYEDIGWSIVPLESFGAAVGVKTPQLTRVINEWNALMNTDYRRVGRTAQSLGLLDFVPKEFAANPTNWAWEPDVYTFNLYT